MNNELFSRLFDIAEYFRISQLYADIQWRFKMDIYDCEKKYTSMKNQKENPWILNVILMIMSFMPFMCIVGDVDNKFPFVIATLVLLVVIPTLNTMRCKKITRKYQKEADKFWNTEGGYICAEDQKNIEKAQKDLEKFQSDNAHVLEFLPERYRNYTAALYMANAVADGRADTLKEVMNLYEEQLHRWEMQRINQEIANQNAALQSKLSQIAEQNDETNRRLRNIENLEFYQTIRNM